MLETARCFIRKVSKNDELEIKKLYQDALVWRFLGGKRSVVQTEESIIGMFTPTLNYFYFSVFEKEKERFLGVISITPHHDGVDMEISYVFKSDIWGKGFAQETISLILSYTFQKFKFKRILAESQAANVNSCKLLCRLGFFEKKRIIRFNEEQIIFYLNNRRS